uniref:Uncharacterized protein n=1 Tax=Anguilla anguilla TaxID=7936 RepID=A0A0E9VNT7_ANGAN
MSDYLECFKMT